MASLNKVMLIGRLGKDPELRYTQSNRAVATFTMATDESYTDKGSGERKEKTEWHRVVVWGRQAETCDQFLAKGRLVYIEGKLQTRDYQDRDGNSRRTTEVVATRVQFLGSRGEGGGGGGKGRDEDPPPPSDGDGGLDGGFSDEDIPF